MSTRRHPTDGRAFAPEIEARGGRSLRDGAVRFSVYAPGVGYWREAPAPGTVVSPGMQIGSLEVLGVVHRLIAPAGVHGAVVDLGDRLPARLPVQFGDVLFRLDPESGPANLVDAQEETAAASEEGLVFRAPSSGRYYARPGPDRDPFVNVGDSIEQGQTVALLEVMKSFHRIAYAGHELPAKGRVVHIFPQDGEDVEMGDPIVRVEPA